MERVLFGITAIVYIAGAWLLLALLRRLWHAWCSWVDRTWDSVEASVDEDAERW